MSRNLQKISYSFSLFMNFAQLGEADFYINVETAVPIMKQPFELFALIFLCLSFGYGFLQYRKNILRKRFKA